MYSRRYKAFGYICMDMRIDKFICDTINITRTQAKAKISSGNVFCDGVCVRSSSFQVDEKSSKIIVDGKEINYEKFVYIMMNKPAGVLSATKDNKTKTAIDLLKESDRKHDLFVAGRLDKDTTGFLLITNDGDFAHNILSPKKHVLKTYIVTLEHSDYEGYKDAFKKGIVLEDGYTCKPADFIETSDGKCMLKISEGKFHQIKRMFLSLNNKVVSLSRVAMGNLELDQRLNFGEYKFLTAEELEKIMAK